MRQFLWTLVLAACRPESMTARAATDETATGMAVAVAVEPAKPPAAKSAEFVQTPGRLAAGWVHSCAIAASGEVYCWGHNDAGQLGDGREVPSRVPVKVLGVDEAVTLAATGSSTCAVQRGGSVWCWGDGERPAQVRGLGPASAVVIGGGTTGQNACALVDGAVWCWGQKFERSTRAWVEVPAARVDGLTGIDEVCLGSQFGCTRDAQRVRCWDDYKTVELSQPGKFVAQEVAEALAGARHLVCLGSYLCALRGNGRVGCAYGDAGMLGHGGIGWSGNSVPSVVVPGIVDAVELVTGGSACAVQADGAVRCWEFDELRPWEPIAPATTVAGIERPRALAIGGGHTCALGQDGVVRCLGDNHYGAVGGGEDVLALTPEPISGTEGMHGLVAGDGFTCGLRAGQPHCWGWIETVPGIGPELATATAVDPSHDVRELGLVPDEPGDPSLCWATGRVVSCFSESSKGARRDDQANVGTPRQRLWRRGAACVLTTEGIFECDRVRLDARSFSKGDPAAKVAMSSDVVEVASGSSMICGRRRGGRVSCVKVESLVLRAAEVEVMQGGRRTPLTDAVALVERFGQVCAVRGGGALVCWAPNDKYELLAEVQRGFESVREVQFASAHGCGIRRDGQVVCEGRNESGQLGDGTVVRREAPVTVLGLRDAREIAVGEEHTCAQTGDDRVWCWGNHLAGGRGARAVRSAETPVTIVQGLPRLLP